MIFPAMISLDLRRRKVERYDVVCCLKRYRSNLVASVLSKSVCKSFLVSSTGLEMVEERSTFCQRMTYHRQTDRAMRLAKLNSQATRSQDAHLKQW